MVELLKEFPIDSPMNISGMTVFAYACANSNNKSIIAAIISQNPNVNKPDKNLRTPLHHAARKFIKPTNNPEIARETE